MHGARIVIADSDPVSLRNLKAILLKNGFVVVGEAEEGLSALKMIRARLPDLAILDANLPGRDGFEVAQIVMEDRLAPVIFIDRFHQTKIIEKAKDSWIFSYLIKPVRESTLLPAIDMTMLNYKKVVELEEEIAKLKSTLESRKVIEKAKGILMQSLGLGEAEAFKRIQKQSMNKRVSMQAVAEAIIMAHEMK